MTDDFNDLNIERDMEEEGEEEVQTPAPGQSNRTFLLAAGILGGLFLFGLILIALFVFLIRPGQRKAAEIAAINTNNTATAVAMTQSAESAMLTRVAKAPTTISFTATPTVKVSTKTPTRRPTNTPVVAMATGTTTVSGTEIAARNTATVSALLTDVASAQKTRTVAPTSTALPTTGFADEVGLPGLFGISLLLIAVIFVVRRLRTA